MDSTGDVLLKFQDVAVKGNDTRTGMIFWDDGSTVCLIREAFADRLKIQGRKICLWVQSAGHKPEKWYTTMYTFKLIDREDQEHEIEAFSVESITSDIDKVNISGVTKLFPKVEASKMRRPFGAVDILVGINYASLHPTVPGRSYINGDLRLLKSMFGTGWVLDGRHTELKVGNRSMMNSLVHRICHSRVVQLVELSELPDKDIVMEKVNATKGQNFFEMEELARVRNT